MLKKVLSKKPLDIIKLNILNYVIGRMLLTRCFIAYPRTRVTTPWFLEINSKRLMLTSFQVNQMINIPFSLKLPRLQMEPDTGLESQAHLPPECNQLAVSGDLK